jgi:hypothetical protein
MTESNSSYRLADLQDVLVSEPKVANEFRSKILEGPLRFTANAGYFRIEGEVSKSKALFGVPRFASPRGFEPLLAT